MPYDVCKNRITKSDFKILRKTMQENTMYNYINGGLEPLVSFRDFVCKDKLNRSIVYISLIVLFFEMYVFRYFFPLPFYIYGDSYQYLVSAFNNTSIDLYPIGYSKFVRLFSVFSSSDTMLVFFQFFFVHFSVLILIFTLDFFYRMYSWVKILMVCCITLNPIFLSLANYISSDALFLALTVWWFVSLLWILKYPSWLVIVLHSFLIFSAFLVRYNALFYPIISFICFALSRMNMRMKMIGTGLTILFIGLFVWHTSMLYKKQTGIFQFSPFSGWQLANNGIYAYKFIEKGERRELPDKFKKLDADVRNYIDSTRDFSRFPDEMLVANSFYMWKPTSPLRTYMKNSYSGDSTLEFRSWSKVAPLYKDYGSLLIKTYPRAFARYFLLPNLIKYYAPPVEFLGVCGFNNADTIPRVARLWFKYGKNDDQVMASYKDRRINLLSLMPIVCAVMTVVFLLMSTSFFAFGGRKSEPDLYRMLLLGMAYWVGNLLFSVFASSIALRFQLFSFVIDTLFSLIVFSFILFKGRESDSKRIASGNVMSEIS